MKTETLLITLLTVSTIVDVLAFDATEAALSADDLATFMNVRHKTFNIEQDGPNNRIIYRIDIYKNGEIIKKGSDFSNATTSAGMPDQKFSILYKCQGDSVSVTVIQNGFSIQHDIEIPKGIKGFPFKLGGVDFDSQRRLVLGFDVEKNKQGGTTFTNENLTPEGTKAALVFQIEIK